jgi:hypothetical protein
MIRISYTPPSDLEVSGTQGELQALKAELEALAQGTKTQILVKADAKANSAPYDHILISFIGRVTAGPTRVSVTERTLEVVGSKESFDGFASFFSFNDDNSTGAHSHHEYYEGNHYVHPQSIPLVISIRTAK